MDDDYYFHSKSFVELPSWYKRLETFFRPLLENELNELRAQVQIQMSASQVRNEGIELAIERYGLKRHLEEINDEPVAGPSGSEPKNKKPKSDPSTEEVIMSAICSAIADKGLMASSLTR